MKVEVCYATADGATRIDVDLPFGATLAQAVDRSGLVQRLNLAGNDLAFAVFGRRATPETVLDEGDRVEMLRPLRVDPKEARHRRVAKKRAARGATG